MVMPVFHSLGEAHRECLGNDVMCAVLALHCSAHGVSVKTKELSLEVFRYSLHVLYILNATGWAL